MLRKLITTLAALALIATPAAAQVSTDFSQASMTINVQQGITLSKTADMTFPDGFTNQVAQISSNGAAAWLATHPPNATLSISFSILPTELTGPGAPIAVIYENQSARYKLDTSTWTFFDPSVGVASVINNIDTDVIIELGGSSEGGQNVFVDLAGAAVGVYSGTVELAVSML